MSQEKMFSKDFLPQDVELDIFELSNYNRDIFILIL